jgi:hypothetical protein
MSYEKDKEKGYLNALLEVQSLIIELWKESISNKKNSAALSKENIQEGGKQEVLFELSEKIGGLADAMYKP